MTETNANSIIMLTRIYPFDSGNGSTLLYKSGEIDHKKIIRESLIEKHLGRWIEDLDDCFALSFDQLNTALDCTKGIHEILNDQCNDRFFINIVTKEDFNAHSNNGSQSKAYFNDHVQKTGIYITENLLANISLQELFDLGIVPQKQYQSEEQEHKSSELSMDEILMKNLNQIVNENLNNEHFSVEDLAEAVSISRSHLHRKLQGLTGQSISQFIREIRLNKGMEMLQYDTATVSEIAYKVGFGSPTYFIKCFTETFGYSPGEAKKKHKDQPELQLVEIKIREAAGLSSESAKEEKHQRPTVIESLQFSSSEALVEEVFQEMTIYKESLGKYLMVDESEGEQIDIRLLAYQIIKNYPWPIGVELRRLFSASFRPANRNRLSQLDKLIERCIRFLNYILVTDLLENVYKKNLAIDNKLQQQLSSSLNSNGFEAQISILKMMVKLFKDSDKVSFVPEFTKSIDKQFFRELDEWSTFKSKNDLNSLSEKDVQLSCDSFEQMVILILKKSAFLVKYKLVNIGTIKVNKRKHKEAGFEHHIEMLNSSDAEFRIIEEKMDDFADSNAVLLMKSIKDPKNFLNLSPLLVDTHQMLIDTTKRNGLKKDIYMYRASSEADLTYIGCETNDNINLPDLAEMDYLQHEIEELKSLINHE